MELIPVFRKDLLARRPAKIEADRQYLVKQTIEIIYTHTLATADNRDTKSYKYPVGESYSTSKAPHAFNPHATMVIKNLTEIIDELRKLFPDCTVQFEKHTEVFNTQDYIVIDWSS
jgi:hypothetical protein